MADGSKIVSLPTHKTKMICTIGPASEAPEMLLSLIKGGMNIARLNYSHSDFAWHKQVMANLRQAAAAANLEITIMADMPGPKIRV
jgi:pyruvate kinase